MYSIILRLSWRLLPPDLVRIIYYYSKNSPFVTVHMHKKNICKLCRKLVGGMQRGMKHHVRSCHLRPMYNRIPINTYQSPPCENIFVQNKEEGGWTQQFPKITYTYKYLCKECGWISTCPHLNRPIVVCRYSSKVCNRYPQWYPIS